MTAKDASLASRAEFQHIHLTRLNENHMETISERKNTAEKGAREGR
jgi:hypothetical protein